jgi:hypothetical protein
MAPVHALFCHDGAMTIGGWLVGRRILKAAFEMAYSGFLQPTTLQRRGCTPILVVVTCIEYCLRMHTNPSTCIQYSLT